MSREDVVRFFEKVATDEDLHGRVQKALDERDDAAAFEVVDIAKEHGCTFTATELRDAAVESKDGALSDQQLEAVAGGVLNLRTLNLSGFRKFRIPSARLRERRIRKRRL